MKLINIKLQNFKGIRNFNLDTQGGNVSIWGDNATGKSTIFDAFTWLLFDKDSQNKKDFEIKTLGQEGQPIHGLEHEVEAMLELENKNMLILRKVYSEKWTKQRGSVQKVFSGHTTDYFIDGVPVQKKDYISRIAEIINEDIFKLLTNPTYFNEQLHWQDRRRILLEVCGDITDNEVISSDDALCKLPGILQGRSLDDHRKVIATKRAEINKELDRIPIRIDEATKALPEIEGVSSIILTQITSAKAKISDKNKELARIQAGGQVAEETKKLREIESKLLDIKYNCRSDDETKYQEKRKRLRELQDKIASLNVAIQSNLTTKKIVLNGIEDYNSRADKLRESWYEVNGQQFTFEQESVCPTCGQDLPEEKLDESREKALADFNLKKSAKLEKIKNQGMECKTSIQKLERDSEFMANEIKKLEQELDPIKVDAGILQEEINAITDVTGADITTVPAYAKALKDKVAAERLIAHLKNSNETAIDEARAEISTLEDELSQLEKKQAAFDQHTRGQERIKELKDQEKKLAAEFEKLEKELYLTEQFIRTKVSLLEEKINSKFEMARFRLFDVQINEGLREVCETTFNGVPYSSGLNTGHRIIVGMDIIRTLSKHYGFVAPIFVDNAESVSVLPVMESQIIRLFKPEITDENREEYSKLVVITEQNILREAI